MQSMGIRELRAHLSRYLRQASLGETILVTRHGRHFVIIRSALGEHDGLCELLRSGRASWSGRAVRDADTERH